MAELNRRGKTVVTVLHELSHALTRSHRVVLLEDGRLVAQGTPEEVCRSGKLREAFGVEIKKMQTPDGEKYYFK